MNRILDAIHFAGLAHRHQSRKVDGTPYISHPLAVGMLLQGAGATEDLVIAGILHDVLEDTRASREELKKLFGEPVLRLVEALSEKKTIANWKRRKQLYIDGIAEHGPETMMVSAADKYHNLHSMRIDHDRMGDRLWSRFNAGKEDQRWFYATLCGLFEGEPALSGLGFVAGMRQLIDLVFA